MYNDNLLFCKQEVIPPLSYSLIKIVFFQKNHSVINLTSDDMISKFEVFGSHKLDAFYQTEIMITEYIQMLDVFWEEENKIYLGTFV